MGETMEEISLKAQQLFTIGSFHVTNSLFLTFTVSLLLIAGSVAVWRNIRLMPSMVQSGVEAGMEWFLSVMESTLGSQKEAERYFPLVATIFIFIMASNLLGLLPGVGSLTINNGGAVVPFFRAPAADLNFTLAYAVISVLATNILGALAVGFFPHMKKFINVSSPVAFFVGMLEIVSEFAKVISLSFRLFGNVFAGEVLLTIVFFLAPYIIPLPFLFLELFVGLIQAFLFAMLTLVSISLHTAVQEH